MLYLFKLVISLISVYFLTNLFGHVIHWILHQKWSGYLNKAHMAHHIELYPPEDYLSYTYREPDFKESTPKFFAVAAIPLILLPIILWFIGILPFTIALISIIEMFVIGAIDYYVHDWFHIKNHWINKVPFLNKSFKKWNHLHYLHHIDMNKNFGIYSFFWDKVFKSYWHTNKYSI